MNVKRGHIQENNSSRHVCYYEINPTLTYMCKPQPNQNKLALCSPGSDYHQTDYKWNPDAKLGYKKNTDCMNVLKSKEKNVCYYITLSCQRNKLFY